MVKLKILKLNTASAMDHKPTLKSPSVLFLSLFGVGFFPFAPGTVASIVTAPLLFLLAKFRIHYLPFALCYCILLVLSIYLSEKAQRKYGLHDPSWIVFDEFLGLIIMYPFVQKNNFIHILICLILFRIFDIIKIWPASYFDKKMKHGAGIIIDDIVSGLMAGLIYLGFFYFKLFS